MHGNKDQATSDRTPEKTTTVSDQRFALINKETLDTSLLGIITARPICSDTGVVIDFEYLTANAALKRTLGMAPEDIVGKTMLGVFPELREHKSFPYYCRVAETGEPISFESEFLSDELDIYVVVSVSRPEPDCIAITFVEVSETVRITDALADLNALSGTPVELDEYIRGAMEIGCRAFKASRAFDLSLRDQGYSITHQTGSDEFPQNKKPLPTEIVAALQKEGRVKSVTDICEQFQNDARSGESRFYRSFIGAPFSADKAMDSALIFCSRAARRRDVTPSEMKLARTLAEAVAARTRLNAASKALQQRNEDLQRFASLVSHDLKAPLRSIRLLSEMLTPYLTEDEQAKTIIEEIQGSADDAQNMIKALRDFSRLGAAGLNVETVDLTKLVEDCILRLATDIGEANAKVEVSDLGNVFADSTLLSQVFNNLILNATKYAAVSDLIIRIDSQPQSGGLLLISVTDNGGGVDMRYAERIFELFRRVPGSEKLSEGEGVGLAACRKIVESLGGKIWLDTVFTAGARFCLTLPDAD